MNLRMFNEPPRSATSLGARVAARSLHARNIGKETDAKDKPKYKRYQDKQNDKNQLHEQRIFYTL